MPYGIMFHHFHGKKNIKSQGSISKVKFIKILDKLKKNYNLINADEFLNKAINKKLKSKEICLTFDDGLKSQYDIALPILKKNKIKSFFFIYSKMLTGISYLEVIRDFRFRFYKNINLFYDDFFKIYEKNFKKKIIMKKKIYKKYLSKYKFYTNNDRIYRYLRDKVLKKKDYLQIMKTIMLKKKYNYKKHLKNILMSENNLKNIKKAGHIIGLHSHNHHVDLNKKSTSQQKKEYLKNKSILEEKFKINCKCMSHPFGRYNKNTLKVLKSLNIKIGFLSNVKDIFPKSNLEFSRIDHNKF